MEKVFKELARLLDPTVSFIRMFSADLAIHFKGSQKVGLDFSPGDATGCRENADASWETKR